jgi:tripartite-type tricarboxylate transporter receptor subunit TctC
MVALAFALVAALGGTAHAEYPEKPIKIIVMFSPGGSSDVATRILARHLEPVLGQPIVIQNINGGGGAVGYQDAMSSTPDGYTLTIFQDGMPVIEATKAVDFTSDDFDMVSVWGTMDLTVFAQKDGPYASLGDYQQAAKDRPGEIGLAMGYGTPAQFIGKIVADAMDADVNLVNVGGGAQKKAAVLGGHVDAGIEPMPGMTEPYRGGQFDILAVLAEERLETFPEIPTAKEQGVNAVHANTYALIAPKGTPPDRIKVIDEAVAQVVQKPEFLEDNAKVNFNITYLDTKDSEARVAEVRAKMLDIGQRLGF